MPSCDLAPAEARETLAHHHTLSLDWRVVERDQYSQENAGSENVRLERIEKLLQRPTFFSIYLSASTETALCRRWYWYK